MKVYFLSLVVTFLFSSGLYGADYTVRIVDKFKQDLSNKSDVLGTNLALWTSEEFLDSSDIKRYLRDLKISDIRIPGGSWSNEYYWNGNGVRTLNGFDLSKKSKEGIWSIDYDDYKPGFRVEGDNRNLAEFHGNIDVLSQHRWIDQFNANSFICFNVGSGSPDMAKEWLKWTKKNDFNVSRAEIGNELNGVWELGHKLKNGESMTADLYAKIFSNYINILKDHDSDLLIGGPASSDLNLDFCETLIKECGQDLDFVSFHAYPVPVSTNSIKEKFITIDSVRDPIKKIRQWINYYQPSRASDIEIGISEWNMKVGEDVDTAGLINALWSTCWIGTLFDEGINFANQWDLSTEKNIGGHSVFNINKKGDYRAKSIYWAMWVWANLMGNELIHSSIISVNKEKDDLFCFATRNETGHQILLVNSNEEKSLEVSLKLPYKFNRYKSQSLFSFKASEYFWNPYQKEVYWSNPPVKLNLENRKNIKLSPFSLAVIHLGNDPIDENYSSKIKTGNVNFEIILPNKVAKNSKINGWITAYTNKGGVKQAFLDEVKATLEFQYRDRVDKKIIKFKNGLSKFIFRGNNDDIVSVRCYNDDFKVEHSIELFDQKLLPVIGWTFDDALESWNSFSTFELSKFTRIKPNQSVAACAINNQLPINNNDIVFHFEPLSDREKYKGKINGVFGEISASDDFICNDTNASIQVVFQSSKDHWVPMGSILLSDMRGKWKNFEMLPSSLQIEEKLSGVYGIRFRMNSSSKFKGEIYLNDLGFIYKINDE